MGAALELLAVPTVLLLALIIFGVAADFSWATAIAAGVAITCLLVSVIALLKEEKEWEGPRKKHEETR